MADNVVWNGATINRIVKKKVKSRIATAGNMVKNRAKELVPIDTGLLRSSIKSSLSSSKDEITASIGSDVRYAMFVELGTSRTRAQPYLRPALMEKEQAIAKLFDSPAEPDFKIDISTWEQLT